MHSIGETIIIIIAVDYLTVEVGSDGADLILELDINETHEQAVNNCFHYFVFRVR